MPELSDPDAKLAHELDETVSLGHKIGKWARHLVPVVALVDEIDAAVGVELKRRLAERYVEELPDTGLAPSSLQRACVGILNHVQSEADHAQRGARHPRAQRNHRAADQRVLAEGAAIAAGPASAALPLEPAVTTVTEATFAESIEAGRKWARGTNGWAAQAAPFVKLIADIDGALGDEVKRCLIADCLRTYPCPSDRIAYALQILLDEAIARLSEHGDAEAKAA